MAKLPKLTREQIKEGLNQIPIDSLLLGSAANAAASRLSPKDREFARLVALGESKAGAYRKTRDSKGNKNTQRVEACKISKKPNVSQMIELFAQAKQFTDSHTPEQLRAFIVQQLTAHAANDDNPPSVRLNALKILGTVAEISAFETRAVVTHVKESGDIRSRILDKLKLIGASTTIEQNSQQDDSQDAESLLSELEQTHTIDAGAIIPDADIAEHGSESGFSHADGILDGVASDALEAYPTPPGAPRFEGVDGELDAHIIPHIQTEVKLNPHIQTFSDSIPHTQISSEPHTQSPSDPMYTVSAADTSAIEDGELLSTVDEPSMVTDSGLDHRDLSTGSVDNEEMSP